MANHIDNTTFVMNPYSNLMPWSHEACLKTNLKQDKALLYLAWDLPLIKHWWWWKIRRVRWQWMNIYGIPPLMPFKELLPEWCHWQGSLSQEHEGNLRNSSKRITLDPWNERSPPEEFGVIHLMQQTRWRPNPTFYGRRGLKARLKRRLYYSDIVNTEMPNHVHAKNRSA